MRNLVNNCYLIKQDSDLRATICINKNSSRNSVVKYPESEPERVNLKIR